MSRKIMEAKSVSVGACEFCPAVHINLSDESGQVFATASIPVLIGNDFLGEFHRAMATIHARQGSITKGAKSDDRLKLSNAPSNGIAVQPVQLDSGQVSRVLTDAALLLLSEADGHGRIKIKASDEVERNLTLSLMAGGYLERNYESLPGGKVLVTISDLGRFAIAGRGPAKKGR